MLLIKHYISLVSPDKVPALRQGSFFERIKKPFRLETDFQVLKYV